MLHCNKNQLATRAQPWMQASCYAGGLLRPASAWPSTEGLPILVTATIRALVSAFLVLVGTSARGQATGGANPGDLALVIAVDVSRSMDDEEFRLQRNGYVEAIRHPDFVRAATSGGYGRIALTYVE